MLLESAHKIDEQKQHHIYGVVMPSRIHGPVIVELRRGKETATARSEGSIKHIQTLQQWARHWVLVLNRCVGHKSIVYSLPLANIPCKLSPTWSRRTWNHIHFSLLKLRYPAEIRQGLAKGALPTYPSGDSFMHSLIHRLEITFHVDSFFLRFR